MSTAVECINNFQIKNSSKLNGLSENIFIKLMKNVNFLGPL